MGLPLLWALGLHALLVLSGAWSSRTEMTEAEPPPPVEALEVEVVSEPPLPGEEPGGGSMEAGQAEFAGGLADEPEPAVGQEPGPEVTEPAARSEAVVAIPDAEDVDVDAYAVDTPETLVTRLRPKPARRTKLAGDAVLATTAGEGQLSRSRHYGLGAGRAGGPGGIGRGWNKRGTAERSVFGGRDGAFRGQVCFIERWVRSLRDIPNCSQVAVLYANEFNVPTQAFTAGFPGVERNEWFSILYTGSFRVRESGRYEFRLVSDDGAQLFIDGELVVDNDGQHAPRNRRGVLALSAGEHALRLPYYQGPRTMLALQLFVTPPAGGEQLFRPIF